MHQSVFDTGKSFVQELKATLFEEHDVRIFIKRDDLIHDEVSGNKWRKLKYNLFRVFQEKREGILTFGGAYSNHLVATAAACNLLGLRSVGIVRGEELTSGSNETLKRCEEYGMKLVFVPRFEYALKNDRIYHESLLHEHGNMLLVPEGGANYYGMIGCQEIMKEVDQKIDDVFVAQGTTTTSCGLALSLEEGQVLHVVPVLKGFESLDEMRMLFNRSGLESAYRDEVLSRVKVYTDYHFGGYGKYDPSLLEFISEQYRQHFIKLDPVYTGKAFYSLIEQIRSGVLDGHRVLFIHTGGIQGSGSIAEQAGVSLYSD